MITIIDYGSGNLRSVNKALDHLGVENRVSSDPADIASSDRVILPGVGAFGACADAVREKGFEAPIREFIATGKPFLGICVGMQILADGGEESPGVAGLGIVKGQVNRFEPGLKVPHMGWNELLIDKTDSKLFNGIPDRAYFYFVHSFHLEPEGDDGIISAHCEYGRSFAAVLERDNVYATQFHPEKSQKWGLKLLENFSTL